MSAVPYIELDDEFFTGTRAEVISRIMTLPESTVISRWEVQQHNGRIDNPGPETVQRYFARNDPDLVFDPDGIE